MNMNPKLSFTFAFAALLAVADLAFAAPDEDLLGKSRGYPTGTYANWFYEEGVRVGSFSNMDKVLPSRTLERAPTSSALKHVLAPPDIQYGYRGTLYSTDDFLQHQRVTGLLIIKDGDIVLERYQYDRGPTHRFLANSMTKSITSLALGVALADGKIASLDDKVAKYVPELAGYAYGDTSLRNVLRMSSGVRFIENYGGQDDLQRFTNIWWTGGSLIKALQAFNERDAKEGQVFRYATSNAFILGLVIKRATGQTLSAYVDEKIWKPMGAESDAKWNIDLQGEEMSGGNFNAVLRDYGRLGALLANDGLIGGTPILPKTYLLEATDWHKQPDALAPGHATPFFGYGYQFWILPGEKRRFALIGVYGQAIYVNPELKLVMVQTAAARSASVTKETLGEESFSLWLGIEKHYQQPPSP